MRGNEFLDKLELVDPAYVEEADEQPPRKRNPWLKWGGLAACLCVAAVAVFTLSGLDPVVMWRSLTGAYDPSTVDDLPPDCIEPDPNPEATQLPGPDGVSLAGPPTSETYSTLPELLEDLRLHDGHTLTEAQVDSLDRYSTAHAAMEGADTVSWEGTVYQLNHDTAKWVGVYQDGVLVGTLDAPADYLFVSSGRLITVGMEYYSGTELDPVYCVRVNIFGLDDPARPERLDAFTQLGDLTACWMNGGTLYLMTDDGVCACGYSRLSSLEDYKPQSFHGEEPFPWPDAAVCILGEPSRVSYVAAVCIDVEDLEVTAQRAFYGDISDVYFGPDWFALVTSTRLDNRYTLQDVYTFDGFLNFKGKLDLAELFGLEKTVEWSENQEPPRTDQRPAVKAVDKSGDLWRMVGESIHFIGPSWYRELFALTFDPETGEAVQQTLRLPEEHIDIDDVLWEDSRAIISAGCIRLESDSYERYARLAFAEFDGMSVELMSSDILCDRVTGIDKMYAYNVPLGEIHPFIPLPNGLYLRYNGTPDGFDVYDLSNSRNPKCLYKSQGDIPEGCRLDFDRCVLDTQVLDTGASTTAVAVKLITPKDGEYRHPDYSWRVFLVSDESAVPELLPEEYPVTGMDPAAIRPFGP